MENEEENEYKEVMEEVEEVKSKAGVNSTTEALLLMIYQTLDSIRFNQG